MRTSGSFVIIAVSLLGCFVYMCWTVPSERWAPELMIPAFGFGALLHVWASGGDRRAGPKPAEWKWPPVTYSHTGLPLVFDAPDREHYARIAEGMIGNQSLASRGVDDGASWDAACLRIAAAIRGERR